MAIFQCQPSSEEERSRTDFSHPVNIQNDWDLIGEILDGESDTDEYPYVEISVEEDELGRDVYYSGGRGLYSCKFVDTNGESSFYGLVPLPAYVNGDEYWYFRCERMIDCLDREKSKYTATSTEPERALIIYKAVFIESKIGNDMFFTIPGRESTSLYMTESVADRLVKANIKGKKLIRDVDINDFVY